MANLSAARLKEVLRASTQAVEFNELDEFRRGVISLVHELVPCESISYNELIPGAGAVVVAEPHEMLTVESLEIFDRFAGENPLISYYAKTGNGQPVRFSDFISARQLHRLTLYDQVYRPQGIEHQIAFVLPSAPGEVIGIALNRARHDFTDEEVGMLDLLRAPLRACYRRLVEREQLLSRLSTLEDRDELGERAMAFGLSARQVEVMRTVARGASNTEVAIGLGISRRTVDKHLEHIYALLDVTSRTQAILTLRGGTAREARHATDAANALRKGPANA